MKTSNRVSSNRKSNIFASAATAFSLAVVGYVVLTTLAVTASPSVEAESASLSSPELAVADSTASGSKALLFKETPSSNTNGGSNTPPSGGGGSSASFLIAAAGDIAQDSGAEKGTSDLILSDPSINTVLTLGDNAYNDGLISEFNAKFEPTWGRFKSKIKPSPGNHEYQSGGGGYFQYFQGAKEYYSFDINSWHFISLNGDIDHSSGSAQVTWLQNDLATNKLKCTLAYWHEPRFTAGSHDDDTSMGPFWDALYAAKADVILNGHSHTYERFAPSAPDGSVNNTAGIREFVVGTGGADVSEGGHTVATREFVDAQDHGIIKMNLSASGYDWNFVTSAGAVKDTGTGTCH